MNATERLQITANKAAAEVRHKIKRKMQELESRYYPGKDEWERRWLDLHSYIDGMAKRASAKPGGLGRK